eukprot:2175717-Alexandrium_andersonii.AAC.1
MCFPHAVLLAVLLVVPGLSGKVAPSSLVALPPLYVASASKGGDYFSKILSAASGDLSLIHI